MKKVEVKNSLTNDELSKIDAYFRAANYLSVAQLYLYKNPLLREPLTTEHIKSKLVGHWGTAPGQNFIYVHLNRIINKYGLNMIYVSGPGHGGQAMVAQSYLDGSYSEVYPNITQDEKGLEKLCKQFSFPGGISSHVAPETPGSINEGGELGYSLAHSFGAVLDNPNLIVSCVVGDGEAETGTLATSWHSNKFLNPKKDGIVLPILHLNGYKIANPTIFGRMSEDELTSFFEGCGWDPYYVAGDDPMTMHKIMSETLDEIVKRIQIIQTDARENGKTERPKYPMIILRTKKGWTGPKQVESKEIEGTFRSHQVPMQVDKETGKNLDILESWLKSYHPEELFDENGTFKKEFREIAPKGDRRMSLNPNANGGLMLKELKLPDFRKYDFKVIRPGIDTTSDMMQLGTYIRDVIKNNPSNFRVFAPDEVLSNRLNPIFQVTRRQWNSKILENDEYIANAGRVIDSMLSENLCEGWLEGYILTGRHGFFTSYEAFIRIIDSMTSQHAKWLKVCHELHWRKDIASLNYVLTSHVWQQDHNGFTHQDPGFLNHIATKKASISRMYLPPDANCLISCFDHIIKSKNYINVIVASKHPSIQWLNMEQAIKHCTNGIGIWGFASNDNGQTPDIVLGCCGDTPTLEAVAASGILRKFLPNVKVRLVNVVDLMRLEDKEKHPHGLSQKEYDMLFTVDKPIIFAFHGYPSLVHQLTYSRTNQNLHVRGYNEQGTITTPFDMRVQNEIDRYHLVLLALKHLGYRNDDTIALENYCNSKLIKHKQYIFENGIDIPEVKNWTLDNQLLD
ncbi:MAG: phosphoketolase family protein [Firmicutes bacterium]|nr:phosphoketolase family protein [Bacillota bacterium]